MTDSEREKGELALGNGYYAVPDTHGWKLIVQRERRNDKGEYKVSTSTKYHNKLVNCLLCTLDSWTKEALPGVTSIKGLITELQGMERRLAEAVKEAGYPEKEYAKTSDVNQKRRKKPASKPTAKPTESPKLEGEDVQRSGGESDLGPETPKKTHIKVNKKKTNKASMSRRIKLVRKGVKK